MLLLVPTVSRSNLGLKENTLAGALYTISYLDRDRKMKPPACLCEMDQNSKFVHVENS